MHHDTTRHHPGIGAVLIAAIAAVQVLVLALTGAPDPATGRLLPREAAPVLLPEVVVTAPRIGS